jgi:hypothetical protein
MSGYDQYSNLSREELRHRLQSAEIVIAEQRKLLQAKESMLQKYMQQFCELTANYEHMIDSHYACADRPRTPPAAAFDDGAFDVAPLSSVTPSHPQDSFQFMDFDPVPEPQEPAPPPTPAAQSDVLTGRRMFQSSITFGDSDPAPVKKGQAAVRHAMEDHFAEPANVATGAVAFDAGGMSVDQMRAKVDDLSAERAELERRLNKALPKGKVMSHLMREREEVEVRFNDVSRTIARIKLEIRRSGG